MATLTLRLDTYSKEARQAIAAAQALADDRRHAEVEPLHVLHRLSEQSERAREIFRALRLDPADVLVEAEAGLRRFARLPDVVAYLSPRTLDLLGRAEAEAARTAGATVGVDQLLLACAQETAGPVRDVLRAVGVTPPVLRAVLERAPPRPSPTESDGAPPGPRPLRPGATAGAPEDAPSRPTTDAAGPIAEFGRDLTALASTGLADPTLGRDAELRRLPQILVRRHENNPLLVGEPGTGRTAIVRGLAARIARGDVPDVLAKKRIVALETSALVAGARLRGQLEERMRALVAAVRDTSGEVILFVPELTALTTEGMSAGGDILAAALGRGEVRVIAITTPDGVRHLEDKHRALLSRFVTVPVAAPSVDETLAILRGIVPRFEGDLRVRIADPALVAAVHLARRYVQNAQLPKAAVDLIDEAAARVRVERESPPAALDAALRRLEALEMQARSLADDRDAESATRQAALEAEAETLRPRAEALRTGWQRRRHDVARVHELRTALEAARRERPAAVGPLEAELADAEAALDAEAVRLLDAVVTPEDVAEVVAASTGIPVAKMLEAETQKLLGMEERLGARVLAQPDAVRAVARAVRRGRVGLRDGRRPIGSFLFLGPTGVGKTELAKALAEFLFDDETSLTRLDMSEFMEKHMVARLLGAPPGYVDSGEGGFLTEAVRRRPYSVVLFDEMEKAHPDVFNILLQVLDDGRLTDSRGRVAHFADTVIIMTSNVGGHVILDHEGDEEALRAKVQVQLRAHFRPEFLNRIDDVILFARLSKDALRGILEMQLGQLRRMLAQRGIELEATARAKDELVERGYDPAFGARPLRRAVVKNVQDPLAEELLRGAYRAGDTVVVDVQGGAFEFGRRAAAGPSAR